MIIFCSDPLNPKEIDPDYQQEFAAAIRGGFVSALFDFDELVTHKNVTRSLKHIPHQQNEILAIYRGWMLKPEDYRLLYDALKNKNITLINTPEQYEYAHCFPHWYQDISDYTPKSLTVSVEQVQMSFNDLAIFGNSPLIVKDYVKSRKHEWADACFISSATDKNEVRRVVTNFVERQGEDLVGDVVLREFVELESIGVHPKSKMPLTREYRAFFLRGKWMVSFPYWSEVAYEDAEAEEFIHNFEGLSSNFYTVDYAVKKDGSFIVIEVGDGQVSGLPSEEHAEVFYEQIRRCFR